MRLKPESGMARDIEPHNGQFEGFRHRFAVRVYYEDTDLSGIVYHANYLRWFERARSDMLRLLGIDQRASQEQGEGVYSVTDLSIRYLAPARLDDDVIIETVVQSVGAASVKLLQCAYRTGTLLTEAQVRVAFVSPEGRPRRQPALWRQKFAEIFQASSIENHNA